MKKFGRGGGDRKDKLLNKGLCPQCVAATPPLQLEQTEQTSGGACLGRTELDSNNSARHF